MSNYDKLDYREKICYECTAYGDDYSANEYGESESNCSDCPYNSANNE